MKIINKKIKSRNQTINLLQNANSIFIQHLQTNWTIAQNLHTRRPVEVHTVHLISECLYSVHLLLPIGTRFNTRQSRDFKKIVHRTSASIEVGNYIKHDHGTCEKIL